MYFIIGFITGGFIMWLSAKMLLKQWLKDVEKLKNFEVWKKWKN